MRYLILLAVPLLALAPPAARAADDKPEKRAAAGTLVTETGSLLRREAPSKPWQLVKEKDEVYTGDLLLGGSGGAVEAKDGGVRLAVVGDVDFTSPFPVLETAFVLHEAKGDDLAFSMDRGRIELTNTKKEGPAKVRLTVRKVTIEVTLKEPGAAMELELYGRWLPGVPFRKEPKAGEEPELAFVVLVMKGEVELKGPTKQFTLKAPPGPALLEGSAGGEIDPTVQKLDKLPDWAANPGSTAMGKKYKAMMARWRKRAAETSLGEATAEMLKSDDQMERRAAVMLLAATDDLERLGEALKETKHQDVWDSAIVAMRHWIGRDPGQDQRLYKALQEQVKFSPREAEGVLQLLHSFGKEDLKQPETYEVLINYLGSERLTLRQLAYWHLARLVPAGKKIGYDPMAPKENRDEAVKQWHKLVPSGELPPRPDDKDK
jgi:hypothetical protein